LSLLFKFVLVFLSPSSRPWDTTPDYGRVLTYPSHLNVNWSCYSMLCNLYSWHSVFK